MISVRDDPAPTLLEPGSNCWRKSTSPHVACLIDNQAYYSALMAALRTAKHSVYILGWAFDPRTRLAPDGSEGPADPDEIGRLLTDLQRANRNLDVRVLIWDAPLGVNGHEGLMWSRSQRWFAKTRVRFRQAANLPFGAAHHQKLVVIDDQLAFCGGGDLVPNRWDTPAHAPQDPRRILPNHAPHPPRHEVTLLVDGLAAGDLGALFRDRWAGATGEQLEPPAPLAMPLWPGAVSPQLRHVSVGIARTQPAWRGLQAVEEIRHLSLACIARARRTIYLENQYFACEAVAQALAARLQEPDGPQIVLIVNDHAPSWFDHMTMDDARSPLIRQLRAADTFGRFQVFAPRTSAGAPIIVHSKVSIFDDRILRVGSANLNNRSGGLDTESELAIEAHSAESRRAVVNLRDSLIAHFLGVDARRVSQCVIEKGLLGAIASLNNGRLTPITPGPVTWWERFVTSRRLGDPADASENWRLRGWRR